MNNKSVSEINNELSRVHSLESFKLWLDENGFEASIFSSDDDAYLRTVYGDYSIIVQASKVIARFDNGSMQGITIIVAFDSNERTLYFDVEESFVGPVGP